MSTLIALDVKLNCGQKTYNTKTFLQKIYIVPMVGLDIFQPFPFTYEECSKSLCQTLLQQQENVQNIQVEYFCSQHIDNGIGPYHKGPQISWSFQVDIFPGILFDTFFFYAKIFEFFHDCVCCMVEMSSTCPLTCEFSR